MSADEKKCCDSDCPDCPWKIKSETPPKKDFNK
jgi:hypothetical protein